MSRQDRLGRSFRRRLARRQWLLLLSVACLRIVVPAHAAGRQAQERAARKACLSGDYAKGASILSDLFIDTKNPTYIFNQGRCFQQNHRYEDAISRFKEYLRVEKNISPEDKADTQKHIADCKEQLGGGAQPAAPVPRTEPAAPVVSEAPAAPATPPAPAATQAPLAAPTVATQVAAPPPPGAQPPIASTPVAQKTGARSPSEAGSGLRTAGIVLAATGGAGLVTGVIFNLKFNSLTSDMKKPDGYTSGKASDRNTYRTMAWTGYGVGAACLATGVALRYLGSRRAVGSVEVALVPALAPGQAGALLQGAF